MKFLIDIPGNEVIFKELVYTKKDKQDTPEREEEPGKRKCEDLLIVTS